MYARLNVMAKLSFHLCDGDILVASAFVYLDSRLGVSPKYINTVSTATIIVTISLHIRLSYQL